MSELMLTVNEVLTRPLFQQAQVVAGVAGLHRRVRWVHIVETPIIDDTIIQGEELILTMGVGLDSEEGSAAFLKRLIEKNASCLFLELGHYIKRIPEEMIAIAEAHQFPLIVFNELVNFIELTQDLHPLIINRHHQMLIRLDKLSRKFHSMSLTSRGVSSIVKLLHEETGGQALYLPRQGTPLFMPRIGNRDLENALLQPILDHLHEQEEKGITTAPTQLTVDNQTILIHPVGAMEQIWGHVAIRFCDRLADEFELLLLDRAAISLSQDLLRKHFIEEKKSQSEAIWMEELLHNRFTSEEQIKPYLIHQVKLSASFSYRMVLIELADAQFDLHTMDEELDSLHLHLSVKIRSAFKSCLFYPFLLPRSNEVVVMAVDLGPPQSGKERLTKVVQSLQSAAANEQLGFPSFRIGIGREYQQLLKASQSYHEARQTLQIKQKHDQANCLFYEETGILRLLLLLEKEPATLTFIEDHLAPLIEHDRTKGTELLKTLYVFLEQDASKQLTAQKLFIVRQTLYHRLEKIKELLGEDFMSADRRLSISLALRAYQFLHRESFEML